jgi:hypothetical protein
MKNLLLFLLMYLFLDIYAQNVKKGFKNLEKKEYEKSKETFQKILSEDIENAAANFGLALTLADDQSTIFSIVDSWQFAERAKNNINKLSQDDIDVISEYFLNTEVRKTSRPVKKKIEIAIDAVEARLIKYIREENNLDAVYEVLERYPDFKHYDNVIHIRNQFEFRKYEIQNTLQGYQEFISKFPNAAQLEKAKNYIYTLAFDNAKTQNSVESYDNYIHEYPKSDHIQSAIKLRNAAAYYLTKNINTLKGYEQFVETYPEALETVEARIKVQDLLYEQAKSIKSLDAYNDFIKRYPEGRYFIDIFNLKADELGNLFILDNNLRANFSVDWAKGFDDNGKIESGGSVAITTKGEYILACNSRTIDSYYSDVWVIKLDTQGKMIWNKLIGQPFEDSISFVLIDSIGDVIVVGFTYLSDDKASKMGWIFKLGADGKKIWNRNLGKIDVSACALDREGRIYIGGGLSEDSLEMKYVLNVFNRDAKKIAERTFTGSGKINALNIDNDGNILVSGSNWLCLLDNRRYLIWEDTLKKTLHSTECVAGLNGYYFAGSGKESIFYSKYSMNGKKQWFQEYNKTDSTQFPVDIIVIDPYGFAVAENMNFGAKIKIFNTDGTVNKVMDFKGNFQISRIEEQGSGLLSVYNNGDIILIRFFNINILNN